MSRKNNRARRKARKERKLSYEQAVQEFEKKYPLRGSVPGPTLLNFMEHFMGREYADARLREAKDPMKMDNILMEKRKVLWEEFNRNGNWKDGVDHLPQGWAKVDEPEMASEPVTYEDLKDPTKFQEIK